VPPCSGLSDVLVDLCCEYEELEVEGGDPGQTYLAHSGMLFVRSRSRGPTHDLTWAPADSYRQPLQSARKLMNSSSTIHETCVCRPLFPCCQSLTPLPLSQHSQSA
jgi:hypothetical protein